MFDEVERWSAADATIAMLIYAYLEEGKGTDSIMQLREWVHQQYVNALNRIRPEGAPPMPG